MDIPYYYLVVLLSLLASVVVSVSVLGVNVDTNS